MAFQLPSRQNKRWLVNGYHPYGGILERTFNVDLNVKPGRVNTTKLKQTTLLDDIQTATAPAMGFRFYNEKYYAIAGSDVLVNAGQPEDAFAQDNLASSPSVSANHADIEIFDGSLCVSDDEDISRLTNQTWTTPVTGLTADTPTLLERFSDRLYYTDDDLFVGSINSGNAKATGTNTLDLRNFFSTTGQVKHQVSMLEAANNELWIATINNANEPGYVFRWNGETEDTFTASYRLDASGVLAGTIQKETNTPFIFTVEGKLLQFNGAGFTEVGRLPLKENILDSITVSSTGNLDRAVHPNGMIDQDGEILILINTSVYSGDFRCPAGIWAYSKENGFYHKFSPVTQDIASTSGDTEYGQPYANEVDYPGALHDAYERNRSQSNGRVLSSSQIYTDTSTSKFAIHTNDIENQSTESGYVISLWMDSDAIDDMWTEAVAKHKRLLNSSDKVYVSYRLDDYEGVTTDATIVSKHKIGATGLGDVKTRFDEGVGHDVFILVGNNAGMTIPVKNITQNGSSYELELKRPLITGNGDVKIFVENWKEVGEVVSDSYQFVRGKIAQASTMCQVKIVMTWQGGNELNEVFVNNRQNTLPE